MGVGQNIKDLYFSVEEKYYKLLDKIDLAIPVYKIVNPIDKVFPSFILLIIVIVAIIAASLLVLFPLNFETASLINAEFTVEDSKGTKLQGVNVTYYAGGASKSAATDAQGKFKIEGLKEGSTLRITIGKTTSSGKEFEGFDQNYNVSKTFSGDTIILYEKSTGPKKVKIYVIDGASKQRITGRNITARLSCTNYGVVPSPSTVTDDDRDGIIEADVPLNCGTLQAEITAEGYITQNFVLNEENETAELAAKEIPKGSLKVKVRDDSGNLLNDVDFKITLYDSQNIFVNVKHTQTYGEVTFTDLSPGSYFVAGSDETVKYSSDTESGISVSSDSLTEVTLNVTKNIAGVLKVEVIDKDTKEKIKNATVSLKTKEGELKDERSTGTDGNVVKFPILDSANLVVWVSHEDYLFESRDVTDFNATMKFELEKITINNSGIVTVKVIDEDDKPVENATVVLRFLDTGIIAPYPQKVTDYNGNVEFKGVKKGSYYAYATKYPGHGDNINEGGEIDLQVVTEFIVKMYIGNTTVEVKAYDEDSELIPEAKAEFFDILGKSIGQIPLTDGTGNITLKADKKIYVIVSHEDYTTVQTLAEQLWPDTTLTFSVVLPPKYHGEPKIELEGVFLKGGKVQELDAGQIYDVKFRVLIPENSNYDEFGVHFRVGENELFDNSPLVIKGINAPEAVIIKGKTYTPPTGYDVDGASENIVDGKDDGKWINLINLHPTSIIYNYSVEIKVKKEVAPFTDLFLHYRAWFKDGSSYLRDPLDKVLGDAANVEARQALYANTYAVQYSEGEMQICEQDFCYAKEKVLDLDSNLYLIEPYNLKINSDYEVSFGITNDSDVVYENSELYVTSVTDGLEDNSLEINEYEFTNADSLMFSEKNLNKNKIEKLGLGNFTKGKTTSMKMKFRPKALASTGFEVKIVADGKIVYTKYIPFTVVSDKLMIIEAEPDVIPAYIPNKIKVTVKSEEEGRPIEKALVRIRKIGTDFSEQVFTAETNDLGIVEIEIPASSPKTKIKIEAEKKEWWAEPIEKIISEEILAITPEQVSAELVVEEETVKYVDFTFNNSTGVDLKFSSIEITGNDYFVEFLDVETMKNYLEQWISSGEPIPALNETNIEEFLKLQLRDNITIDEAIQAKGKIVITVSNIEVGGIWVFEVPIAVNISLAGMPDNESCIEIEGINVPTWDSFTEGSEAKTEFRIINNCLRKTKEVDLKNIKAKLVWDADSPHAGTVELSVNGSASALVPDTWVTVYGTISGGETLNALLRFIPDEGYEGKVAKFKVFIDSGFAISSEEGEISEEFINKEAEFINATITIANLEQCIKYLDGETDEETDLVKMYGGGTADDGTLISAQDETTFKIDISNCGNTKIEFILCWEDPGCKGGTSDVLSGINLEPKENTKFTLEPAHSTKEITVERGKIPGMYGIPVYATTPGGTPRFVKLIDVEIEPEGTKYFALGKYDFMLTDEGSTDATTLTNRMPFENVTVHANYCNLKIAVKNDTLITAFGFAMVGFEVCGPICAGIGFLIGFLGFGKKCGDYHGEVTMPDWVMNLSGLDMNGDVNDFNSGLTSDAKGISFLDHKNDFSIRWDLAEPDIIGNEEKVGAVIEKTSGMQDPMPTYAVIKVEATEHIHGDIGHSAANPATGSYDVFCKNSKFAKFNIGISGEEGLCEGSSEKTYSQKFHLKIQTETIKQEIAPPAGAEECTQGVMQGYTGTSALPKVAFRWDWGDSQTGNLKPLTWNACDYKSGSEDYIYCDATQFSITLAKKLNQLDEFLKQNPNLECPQNWYRIKAGKEVDESNSENGKQFVLAGKIGLEEFSATVSGNNVAFKAKVNNKSSKDQNAIVVNIIDDEGATFCSRNITSLAVGQTTEVSCTINNLPAKDKLYFALATISGTGLGGNPDIDSRRLAIGFVIWPEENGCFLDYTTEEEGGTGTLELFLNKNVPNYGAYVRQSSVMWRDFNDPNSSWHSVATDSAEMENVIEWLRGVTHFNAYLIKDGYGSDFRQDFTDYYSTQEFAGTPTYFNQSESGKWADYFTDDGKMKFRRKYIEEGPQQSTLQGPGLYKVDVDVKFGNKWAFFENGNPAADIEIVFLNIGGPETQSPFYYLPFDGMIGIDSDNGRNGYGMNYTNENSEISITKSLPPAVGLVETSAIPSPNALMSLNTSVNSELKTVNSVPSTRGMLLKVSNSSGTPSADLIFSPNYATPVLLKMTSEVTTEPFGAYYMVKEDNVPLDVGSILTYWNGAGTCLDFTGDSVSTAFRNKADSEATADDHLQAWENVYATRWTRANKAGNVFLKSVIYTPVGKSYTISRISPAELYFITTSEGTLDTVGLNGIRGMANNDKIAQQNASVNEINKIFGMVENKDVCLTNMGVETMFWWNPSKLPEPQMDSACITFGN